MPLILPPVLPLIPPSARFRFASSRCMLSPNTSISKYSIRLISPESSHAPHLTACAIPIFLPPQLDSASLHLTVCCRQIHKFKYSIRPISRMSLYNKKEDTHMQACVSSLCCMTSASQMLYLILCAWLVITQTQSFQAVYSSDHTLHGLRPLLHL